MYWATWCYDCAYEVGSDKTYNENILYWACNAAFVGLRLASEHLKKIKELILQVYRMLCERFIDRIMTTCFARILTLRL